MTALDPSFLPQLLNRIVDVGCTALETSPNGKPGFCGLYHAAPPADCCDALVVYVERLTMIKSFPQESQSPIKCDEIPMVSGAMRLFRPCWPTIKIDAHNPFPGNETTTVAAINLMMDASALYCALASDLGNTDGVIKAGNPLAARLGQLTPQPPRGGCASWTVSFQIELNPCC